jgi:uncharacterized membrane protein (DUF485 family)
MPGFDQAPAKQAEPAEDPVVVKRRVRVGHVLFAFYTALYAGFMLLNAFAPEKMENTPLAGLNIAVLYGLALIAVAFLLALAFEALCRWIGRDKAPAKESR